MNEGGVLGHETMGIVETVGPDVKFLKPGDRVVVSYALGCGNCDFCHEGLFASCRDAGFGEAHRAAARAARTTGSMGSTALTSGYWGGQAEFVRVPAADFNCLPLPAASELPDCKALFLSDLLPTAWFACNLAGIEKGECVGIWGATPVGLLAAQCAFARGARRVLLIDDVPWRLAYARSAVPGVEVVDSSGEDSIAQKLRALCAQEPDGALGVAIEAVGMHYSYDLLHRAMRFASVKTEQPRTLNSALQCVRSAGRVGVVGVYPDFVDHVDVGTIVEKGLTVRFGQAPVQFLWQDLLGRVRRGELDPSVIVTHTMPLEMAPEAYRKYADKEPGVLKVVLTTRAAIEVETMRDEESLRRAFRDAASGHGTVGTIQGVRRG